MGITIKCYGGAPGNRGASLFPEGRTYSPPEGAVVLAVGKPCALRGGLRLLREPLDKAAFLPNCQPCPCSRRRGFHFGIPCSWGGILPPHPAACLRQPATGSLTQMQGWNESLHPCWRCVAFHDVLSENKGALFWGTPFRKDKVIYGDLSFGGQNSQPWSWALRRGCCGLSELFPDAQRVRRGAARLHPQTGPWMAAGFSASHRPRRVAGSGNPVERCGGNRNRKGQPPRP